MKTSSIGRIVMRGRPPYTHGEVLSVLEKVADELVRRDTRVKYLVTPARFVWLGFPEKSEGSDVSLGWDSDPDVASQLADIAHDALNVILDDAIVQSLKRAVDVLTIGVDIHTEAEKQVNTTPHAELVGIYHLKDGVIDWTGKSYPTPKQQNHLVHWTDLSTHFLKSGEDRIMVLGCHDLNMWSPRTRAVMGSKRRARVEAMSQLAREFQPTTVLHHPHQTQSPNVWRHGWAGLVKELPSVREYTSGIDFYPDPRRDLDKVLVATSRGKVENVIVEWGLSEE